MSASLVGSEMCIRDRILGPELILPSHQSYRLVPTCDSWGVAGGTGAAAVSYTHLTLPTICSV
eukprot:8376890-Alexandrium_andersonii.AAC.1